MLAGIEALFNKFLVVAAMQDPGTTGRNLVGSAGAGNIAGPIGNILWGNIFPAIMTCVMFACVLAIMISGARLAASGIFQDPRGRMMSIVGLISGAVGTLVCVNAQPICALVAGISLTSSVIMGIASCVKAVVPKAAGLVHGLIAA